MDAPGELWTILNVGIGAGTCAAMVLISLWRPYLGFMFFFFFFAFGWRLVSVLYIDTAGPVVSEQLYRSIGPGLSSLALAAAQILILLAILFSFRVARLESMVRHSGAPVLNRLGIGSFSLSDFAFVLALAFLTGLYVELLASQHIPLFERMERYTYTELYGGVLHHIVLEWGAMLSFQLGVFFSTPALGHGKFDRRFSWLLCFLLGYLALVGNRFSAFYAYTSFFIMPVGAAVAYRYFNANSRLEAERERVLILRGVLIAGLVLLLAVMSTLAYSYIAVRGFHGEDLEFKIVQRILVQQGEMWWMTFERVFLQGSWDFTHAMNGMFLNPFDPQRNSTMEYLMELALPTQRAHEILGQGSAYTGGWPEGLFELAGPVGGFVLVGLSAGLFSEFMFLVARCVFERRFATLLFLTPILYAAAIYLVSGMLNSFIQTSFLLKAAVAILVYVLEDRWRLGLAQGKPVSLSIK